MPSEPPGTRWTWALRGACLLAALACLGAAVGAERVLGFLAGLLGPPRDPGLARSALRAAALAGLVLALVVALSLPWLRAGLERGVEGLAGLSPRQFAWTAAAAALGTRAMAALLWHPPATSDARWYHAAAVSLAAGQGLAVDGAPTAYRPPGYPFLLSLLYRAFGPHPALAWLPGLAATALLLAAVHRAGRRLEGETRARVAVLILALHPSLALATGQAMSDLPVAAALAVLVAWSLEAEPWRLRDAALLGCALGLLALTRSVAAAFLPAFLLGWQFRRPDARRLAVSGLLAALLMLLPLGAWAARNARVLGRAVVATNVGLNLHIGNHPGATGGYGAAPPVDAPSADETAVDAAHGAAARVFLREHPLEALRLWPKKLFHLAAFDLSAAQEAFGPEGRPAWLKALVYGACQGFHLLLMAAFLVAWIRVGRPLGGRAVGLAIGGVVVLVSLATFGQDRFRMPFLPWMALLAASPLVAGRREMRH